MEIMIGGRQTGKTTKMINAALDNTINKKRDCFLFVANCGMQNALMQRFRHKTKYNAFCDQNRVVFPHTTSSIRIFNAHEVTHEGLHDEFFEEKFPGQSFISPYVAFDEVKLSLATQILNALNLYFATSGIKITDDDVFFAGSIEYFTFCDVPKWETLL